MIAVFKWGWGEEGKSVAFWGWADSAVILNDFICVLDKTERAVAFDISRRGGPGIVCSAQVSKTTGFLQMPKLEGSTAQTKSIQHGFKMKYEIPVTVNKSVSEVNLQKLNMKDDKQSIGNGTGLRAGLVNKISEQKVNKK
ncbi:MAG: hypothetical protein HYS21_13710 [Deltaproteobacteria bacterium]|nr:hypothetical protein [Deltaproteobacteria bacterium]